MPKAIDSDNFVITLFQQEAKLRLLDLCMYELNQICPNALDIEVILW